MLDINAIRAQIASIVQTEGGDPALALADAQLETAGTFNPKIVGDQGHSVGLFQENDQGAGYGLSDAERSDVAGSTKRFVDRVKRLLSTGYTGTPGEIAWEVQKPLGYPNPQDQNSIGYINRVNELYTQYHDGTVVSGGSTMTPNASGDCPPGWHRGFKVFGFEGVCVPNNPSIPTIAGPGAQPNVPTWQQKIAPGLESGIGQALAAIAIPVAIIVILLFLTMKGIDKATS